MTYDYDVRMNLSARSLFSTNLSYLILSMRFWCPQITKIIFLANVSISKYFSISINNITVSSSLVKKTFQMYSEYLLLKVFKILTKIVYFKINKSIFNNQ